MGKDYWQFMTDDCPAGWCKECGFPVNVSSINGKDSHYDIFRCRGCECVFKRMEWPENMFPSQGFKDKFPNARWS